MRYIPIAALLAAFSLPLPAPAQVSSDDDRFGDEDRQETRLPEVAWKTRFTGQYAVGGACDDSDAVWTLTEVAVQMGRINCLGIGKPTWEENGLAVPLSQCSSAGGPLPSRFVDFREAESGITATTEDGETVSLTSCR